MAWLSEEDKRDFNRLSAVAGAVGGGWGIVTGYLGSTGLVAMAAPPVAVGVALGAAAFLGFTAVTTWLGADPPRQDYRAITRAVPIGPLLPPGPPTLVTLATGAETAV